MNYSSIFVYCFIVVINLSLSEAAYVWHIINPLEEDALANNNYNNVNIGNGTTNNIITVHDRFGDDSTPDNDKPKPTQAQHSRNILSINNIGNGYQNSNTVVTVNDGQKTVVSQSNDDGTSFQVNGKNGKSLFNVGYGSVNQNKVIISDASAQPDDTGSPPSVSSDFKNQLKKLHNITEKLQHIVRQLIEEIQMSTEQQ